MEAFWNRNHRVIVRNLLFLLLFLGCNQPNVIEVVNYPLPQIAGEWRIASYVYGDTLGYAHIEQNGLILSGWAISRDGGYVDLNGQVISGTREGILFGSDYVHDFNFDLKVDLSNRLMDVRYRVVDRFLSTVVYESYLNFVRIQ